MSEQLFNALNDELWIIQQDIQRNKDELKKLKSRKKQVEKMIKKIEGEQENV